MPNAKMPISTIVYVYVDVAEMVLNHCIDIKPKNRAKDVPEYQVLYMYEFIEDYEDEIESENKHSNSSATPPGVEECNATEENDSSTYNCGFDDVDGSKSPSFWAQLKSFQKSNHPLQIMVT